MMACSARSLLARQYAPLVMYPEGQDPVLGTAAFAELVGLQNAPLVMYPDGQEPDLGSAFGEGAARTLVLNNKDRRNILNRT